MKKTKFLTSLTGLVILTTGLIPSISGCSCNKSTTETVELDESVTKQGVTVKSSNIQKDKESTIELNLPSGKSISAITLEIGNTTLSKSDVTIDNAKITIPAAKMSAEKVTIKSITLSSEPTPTKTITEPTTESDRIGKTSATVNWNDDKHIYYVTFPGLFTVGGSWTASDIFTISADLSYTDADGNPKTVNMGGAATAKSDTTIQIALSKEFGNSDSTSLAKVPENTPFTVSNFIIKNTTKSEEYSCTLQYSAIPKSFICLTDEFKHINFSLGDKTFGWSDGTGPLACMLACNFPTACDPKTNLNFILNFNDTQEAHTGETSHPEYCGWDGCMLRLYEFHFTTDVEAGNTVDYGFKITSSDDQTIFYEKKKDDLPKCQITFS